MPVPTDRPHGPRRCGGPEHHGVSQGSQRAEAQPRSMRDTRASTARNQQFLNYECRDLPLR